MFSKLCDLKNFPKLRVSNCAYSLELYQRPATLLKELRCNICEFFNNTFFAEHLRATAFIIGKKTVFTAAKEQLFCGKAFLRWPFIFMELCFRRMCKSSYRECSYKIYKIHRKTPMPESCLLLRIFAKFSRVTFFENTSGWLLLVMCNSHFWC